MTGRPRISAVLCTYNRLRYLPAALDSVYRQGREDMEVVLVDDGSTDGTEEWVRGRRFPGLRYFRWPRNKGPAAARNQALRMARGTLIAFLDSDDVWYDGYLRTMLAAFSSAKIRAAFCNYDVIDGSGKLTAESRFDPKWIRAPALFALAGLARFPLLSTCVFRTRFLRAVGEFDPGLRHLGEDVDLWYRIGLSWERSALRFVRRPLAAYRRHGSPQCPPAWVERGPAWKDGWGLGKDLSRRDKERLLDMAYLCRKHASWAEPLLEKNGLAIV